MRKFRLLKRSKKINTAALRDLRDVGIDADDDRAKEKILADLFDYRCCIVYKKLLK